MNYKRIEFYDSHVSNSDLVKTHPSYSNAGIVSVRNTCVAVAVVFMLIAAMCATVFLIKARPDTQTTKSIMPPTTARESAVEMNIATEWLQNGRTVAGGRGAGRGLTQLYYPDSLYIDDEDQSLWIDEWQNDRIVKWKIGAMSGQIVAGGKGPGSRTGQLFNPSSMAMDTANDSMIICDHGNRRIVRWPRHHTPNGEVIIANVDCLRLAVDNTGAIYVSDHEQHVVKRWRQGDIDGTIVAGGNGQGPNLDQLHTPTYIFVDDKYSVYVSDQRNHRVIKWLKDAKEGIVIAGGYGEGDHLTQLSNPEGLFVDQSSDLYVADNGNHRIMRWPQESIEGAVILGGNGQGRRSDQFDGLRDISFDRQGNLYVIDNGNQRIQKFDVHLK